MRISVFGAVQGVGFRPFVYRLAKQLNLTGSVLNCSSGVFIEVEGSEAAAQRFLESLRSEAPPASILSAVETSRLEPVGYTSFLILPSDGQASKTSMLLPDLATCPACRSEIMDPRNRRFRYAFTNCTHCGPRYTIIRAIPYDRPNTSMAGFAQCDECSEEYGNPEDRRFHAQPNACPKCGPRLEFAGPNGLPADGDPIELAARAIHRGLIVAVKGIGGFQLLVDARNSEAVRRLRDRKHREEKPLAVMFPSRKAVAECCRLTPEEQSLLNSSAAPIVLLRPVAETLLAPEVSKASPYVGAMLPYSPLHHLLLGELGFPVVATSGNRSEEPIAIGNHEALHRLSGIADAFLWHDRPVERPCDDSVAKVMGGQEMIVRRARGYAPLPVRVAEPLDRILAVGAHLKNTVAITVDRQVVIGQHVGDLETLEARQAFHREIEDLSRLYEFEPRAVACDLHPDYYSTRFAEKSGLPVVRVQHHHAHVAACAAENDVSGPYLGVAWDGTGYGLDHTVWGGEFFLWDGGSFERVAHLRPFRIPGGEQAIRDARRTAWGLLSETFGQEVPIDLGLSEFETKAFRRMSSRSVNAPVTTSMGRLFDGCAAIAGVGYQNRFEGHLPMALEAAIGDTRGNALYPLEVVEVETIHLDWRPVIEAQVADGKRGLPLPEIALKLHNTFAEWVAAVARRVETARVVLSGGVFQNAYLLARVCERLRAAGLQPITHQRIPPNDGGIALGQAVLAGRYLAGEIELSGEEPSAAANRLEEEVRCA